LALWFGRAHWCLMPSVPYTKRWWQFEKYDMKKLFLQLLYLTLPLTGFCQEKFTITIDSACFQSNDSIKLDGEFGLYGDMRITKHPFWVKDTLMKTLEFKQEQILTGLEPMQYTLRFTPYDSTERSHSVQIHSQSNYINLSCFFFNKSYPLVLREMKNNDYIKLVSSYAGPTNMATAIPIYALIIVKKRRYYYARYWETSTNEHGLRFMDIKTQPVRDEKIKIDSSYVKLSEEHLEIIENFWSNLYTCWFDNDYSSIPSNTVVYDKNGYFNFQSNEYISQILWEKLN